MTDEALAERAEFMRWPNPTDYQDVIQNPRQCFADPELQRGTTAVNALGLPRVASGNFASVYEVQSGGRRWAVRCFLRQNGNQQRHYEQVSEHLQGTWLPFMVHFEYLPSGIRVHGQTFPIVRMEWVEGVTLHNFIGKHVHDAQMLRGLAAQWRGLVNSLQGSRLAHGDLQHGNVLVTAGGQMRLVDYDAMYVPALHGSACTELGHANYQHPQRAASDYDSHLDNFSALVIYVSLRALASEPALWNDFHTGDNLLFLSTDFKTPAHSAILQRLKRSSDAGVGAIAARLEQYCQSGLADVGSFETTITAPAGARLPSVVAPRAVPTSASAPGSPSTSSWWTQASSAPPTHVSAAYSPAATPTASASGKGTVPSAPFALPAAKNNLKDSSLEMLLIPAGEFLMGSEDYEDEKPPRSVHLDAYYLSRNLVTVAQYRKFCTETGRALSSAPSWGWKDDHPIVNVSWHNADAYCTWAGGRLPTEAQWEKAARGTDGRKFPWGSDFNSAYLQCSVSPKKSNSTAPVGSFPGGAGPYGCLDMAGNVWEWCADWYGENYYKNAPVRNPSGPSSGSCRVLRGGSWVSLDPVNFRASFRLRFDPIVRYSLYGFRVASGL